MRRSVLLATVVLVGGYQLVQQRRDVPVATTGNSAAADSVAHAYSHRLSRVQVHDQGIIAKVLSDDTEGSPHQKFIVRMSSGESVLFAHNIDLAGRVPNLSVGARIEFEGEYEWNEKGGVIHWTHRDPAGRHPSGWLKYQDITYQ